MYRTNRHVFAAALIGVTLLSSSAMAGTVYSGQTDAGRSAASSAVQSAVRDARDQASQRIRVERRRTSHRSMHRQPDFR